MARYIRRGNDRWIFAPAVANKAAPTRAEINAGTVLHTQMSGVDGFAYDVGSEESWDWASTYDKNIPGTVSSPDSSLTFRDDNASSTIRTALAKNTAGFIIRMPQGDVAGRLALVFPVRSKGANHSNDPGSAQFTVGFAIEDEPEMSGVVPAP